MASLRFWQKIYIFTLALFLLFLNSSIVAVCLISKTQSDNAIRTQALTQQQVLVQRLAQDIKQVKGLRPYALDGMYKQAEKQFQNEGFLLEIVLDNNAVFANSLLQTQDKRPELSCKAGQRVYTTRQINSEPYFIITTALSGEGLEGYYITVAQSIEKSESVWQQTVWLFTGASIILSCILAVALYAALARISRPLVGLARTAEDFAAGNHEARVNGTRGNDEIALLSRSFNRMAQQTQLDMQKLASAAEEKQTLVDAMSHEMRTPLTAIHGYAEYIQRANLSDDEKFEATEYIMAESHRLEQVANQLLRLAVLRGDEILKEPVNLLELMHRTYRTVLPKAGKRGVKVAIEKPPNEKIMADEALLESLLVNLIDNAVKACAEGGAVALNITLNAQTAVFVVRDNGRGMTQEQLDKIGKPFYRADKARSRAEGGAGLGLSLCFQIVQSHGGTLSFASVPNEGTTVTLTLPRGTGEEGVSV